MAASVPVGLPIRARAGDTWQFDLSYPNYPQADGWTVAVYVRGPGLVDWDAAWRAVQGTGWRITIPATATADLPQGTYQVAAVLTLSGVVVTADTVSCVVQANLATAAAGEGAVWEETMVAAVKTAIQSLTEGKVKVYMIGNRQVSYHDLPELTKLLGALEARLARRRNPTGLGQSVKFRFKETRP